MIVDTHDTIVVLYDGSGHGNGKAHRKDCTCGLCCACLTIVLYCACNPESTALPLNTVDTYKVATQNVARGSLTDRSGAIATGGTHQAVMAANPLRKYLLIQNISDTDMELGFGTNATADSLLLKASGGTFIMENSFICTDSIDILCASTGKKYVAKEG